MKALLVLLRLRRKVLRLYCVAAFAGMVLYVSGTVQAQELWGIDVLDTNVFYTWKIHESFNVDACTTETTYYKNFMTNIMSSDEYPEYDGFVIYFPGKCLTFSEDVLYFHTFETRYEYLFLKFGKEDKNYDYDFYSENEILDYHGSGDIASQVRTGMRYYWRSWDLDSIKLDIVWKGKSVSVYCYYKE